ncbi:hypothetical protein LXL04_009073 [Taraxacum kok-saghyz]
MKAMSMELMIGIEHRPIPGTQFSARNSVLHNPHLQSSSSSLFFIYKGINLFWLFTHPTQSLQNSTLCIIGSLAKHPLDLPNTKNVKLKLEPEGKFYFSATVGSENLPYEIDINFHDKVKASKASVGPRTIVYLIKKEESKWWNRLLKEEERLQSGADMDFGDIDFLVSTTSYVFICCVFNHYCNMIQLMAPVSNG